ncbi:hypothetical protein EVAR_45942_1 [Eumeta japonica]|uniref:Uncharacterized protein n=1 Tax=Eumeta variegata TaxID=151549 RepID=A0A4C1W7K8_EUMVA|nr:hypothetical protein EVAR_45942_1 [Eumeta japonica]
MRASELVNCWRVGDHVTHEHSQTWCKPVSSHPWSDERGVGHRNCHSLDGTIAEAVTSRLYSMRKLYDSDAVELLSRRSQVDYGTGLPLIYSRASRDPGKAHKNNKTLEELDSSFKDLISSTQQLVCLCLFAVPRCTCPGNRFKASHILFLVHTEEIGPPCWPIASWVPLPNSVTNAGVTSATDCLTR